MKIGILRESLSLGDKRAPLSPAQCKHAMDLYPGLEFIIQPSSFRCFSNNEFAEYGLQLQENLDSCDLLIGIKEVEVKDLIADKTYIFFSHTTKKQSHNKELLSEILKKNIRLIDFEMLTDDNGIRIIGFGRIAGIVGAYNGIRAYCIRNVITDPGPAYFFNTLDDLIKHVQSIKLPNIKIAVTGGGRVANGAIQLLKFIGIKQVAVDEYLTKKFNYPAFAQLEPNEYVKNRAGGKYNMKHFYSKPQEYVSNFLRFCSCTDVLINAAFWNTEAPTLFTVKEMISSSFSIKVIADITCDINGSIPTTIRASKIEKPFYDYNPKTQLEEKAFSVPGNLTIMAVDNLPCELPKESSILFGKDLTQKVLPLLLGEKNKDIVQRATIADHGMLNQMYGYLNDWLNS